jgi:arginine-tRNA-protein transferase
MNIESLKLKCFRIEIKRAKFEKETFELYKKYCKAIHNKKKESASSFVNFLCMRSLEENDSDDESVMKVGCFHMKYYLHDKLIAVGVVDVLP